MVVGGRNIVDALISPDSTTGEAMATNTAIVRLNEGESVWLESYDSAGHPRSRNCGLIRDSSYRLVTFSGVFFN